MKISDWNEIHDIQLNHGGFDTFIDNINMWMDMERDSPYGYSDDYYDLLIEIEDLRNRYAMWVLANPTKRI